MENTQQTKRRPGRPATGRHFSKELGIVVPPAMHERLMAVADMKGISMSCIARTAIEQYLIQMDEEG